MHDLPEWYRIEEEQLLSIEHSHSVNLKGLETWKENNRDLINAVKNKHIVYCIWVDQSPVYVGQSHAKYSRSRMIHHLHQKHYKTGSKLDKVKAAVDLGSSISLSFVSFSEKDKRMRHVVEAWKIARHVDRLEWNSRGTQ